MEGEYAWGKVSLVRGSVVEFVAEFCSKVAAAVVFDVGSGMFLETEEWKCVMQL